MQNYSRATGFFFEFLALPLVLIATAPMQFCTTVIFILCSAVAFGQQVRMSHSEVMQDKKNATILEAFPASDSTFLLLKRSDRSYASIALEEFSSSTLKPRNFNQIILPEINGLQLYFDRVVTHNGKTVLLATAEDKDNMRTHVYGLTVFPDLNVAPEAKLLGNYYSGSKKQPVRYLLFSNPIGYLSLILPQESDAAKNEKFELRLFDAQLNLKKNKELEIPHPSGSFRIEDVLMDGDSIINILASVGNFEDQSMSRGKDLGRDYTLLRYLWNTNTLSEKALAFDSKWVYDARLLHTAEHNLQVIGFYSNYLDLTLAGTFSVIISGSDGSLVYSGLQPLPREFKKKFRSGATIEENSLDKFKLKYVFAYGSTTLLIAEKQYSKTATIYNPATGTYSVINVYSYDEIILNYLNEYGALVKSVMIPKFQTSTRPYDEYTSFSAVNRGETTRIFYNDNIRNADLSLDSDKYRSLSAPTNAVCMMVTLGEDKIRKEVLFGENSAKLTFNSNLLIPIYNGAILFATAGSKFQLHKLMPVGL